MLDYTVTYRSTDNNPCDNISKDFGTIKSTDSKLEDYINFTGIKETDYTEFMTKPETLTLASVYDPDRLAGALSECTLAVMKETSFDCAKYLGELLAASGSNAG